VCRFTARGHWAIANSGGWGKNGGHPMGQKVALGGGGGQSRTVEGRARRGPPPPPTGLVNPGLLGRFWGASGGRGVFSKGWGFNHRADTGTFKGSPAHKKGGGFRNLGDVSVRVPPCAVLGKVFTRFRFRVFFIAGAGSWFRQFFTVGPGAAWFKWVRSRGGGEKLFEV